MPTNSLARSALFSVLSLAFVACATTPISQHAAIDDAKSVIQSHERFAGTGDLDGVMSNVADDIVVLADEIPLIKGRTAFREFYGGFMRAGTFDLRHDYEGAEVVGNTVLLHGVARGNFVPSNGRPVPFANNFILVLKRQPNSRFQFWRIAFAPSARS
jgi:ketosteroid isomerase-like protein